MGRRETPPRQNTGGDGRGDQTRMLAHCCLKRHGRAGKMDSGFKSSGKPKERVVATDGDGKATQCPGCPRGLRGSTPKRPQLRRDSLASFCLPNILCCSEKTQNICIFIPGLFNSGYCISFIHSSPHLFCKPGLRRLPFHFNEIKALSLSLSVCACVCVFCACLFLCWGIICTARKHWGDGSLFPSPPLFSLWFN